MPERGTLEGPLLLVGGGKMGGALLDGWLARGIPAKQVTIVEPGEATRAMHAEKGVNLVAEPGALPAGFAPQVLVIAIKPQVFADALPAYAAFAAPSCLVLSIAAGKTIANLAGLLGDQAAIVRAMPNTPAAVGRGISVFCANRAVTEGQKRLAAELLAAVGEVAAVEEEALLDPVTAVSGGGPAYVFLLIECLAKAGEEAGLSAELAMRLARATVCGAGELAHRSPESASQLRENVTSPGGTTLEALKILMAENGLQSLMTRAVEAATKRSRELAS